MRCRQSACCCSPLLLLLAVASVGLGEGVRQKPAQHRQPLQQVRHLRQGRRLWRCCWQLPSRPCSPCVPQAPMWRWQLPGQPLHRSRGRPTGQHKHRSTQTTALIQVNSRCCYRPSRASAKCIFLHAAASYLCFCACCTSTPRCLCKHKQPAAEIHKFSQLPSLWGQTLELLLAEALKKGYLCLWSLLRMKLVAFLSQGTALPGWGWWQLAGPVAAQLGLSLRHGAAQGCHQQVTVFCAVRPPSAICRPSCSV